MKNVVGAFLYYLIKMNKYDNIVIMIYMRVNMKNKELVKYLILHWKGDRHYSFLILYTYVYIYIILISYLQCPNNSRLNSVILQ